MVTFPSRASNDRLFFFGSFNPSLNQINFFAPNTPLPAPVYNHGPFASSATTPSWAGKLSAEDHRWQQHSTHLPSAIRRTTITASTLFLQRPAVPEHQHEEHHRLQHLGLWQPRHRRPTLLRRLNPTTQLNIAATYKTSNFTEAGFDNIYSISDRTRRRPGLSGTNGGIVQNPKNKSYGATIDIQKVVNLFGPHTFSGGFGFGRATYLVDQRLHRSAVPVPVNECGWRSHHGCRRQQCASLALLRARHSICQAASSNCPTTLCPFYQHLRNGPVQVYLRQVRGLFSAPTATSNESYLSSYVNDSWAINRRMTINAGLRWEEEQLNGPNQQYVFNDNWSPRLGINIDPFADRKTKVYFNWGRYTQGLPTDAAIRELNQELDVNSPAGRRPPTAQTCSPMPDGTITPILDSAHLLSGITRYANSSSSRDQRAHHCSSASPELIHSGTKLNFEEEYLLGVQREVASGMVLDVRYSDRRLQRIVEDMQGVSPEGANAGLPNQIYLIGNPSPASDYFINEIEEKYNPHGPASCELRGRLRCAGGQPGQRQ